MAFSVATFIQENERLSLKLIPDAGGTWQIGYGRNLSRRGISYAEAIYLFSNDLIEATSDAALAIGSGWQGLDSVRQAALTDMAYNLGGSGLAEFTHMIDAIRAQNWDVAATELLNSAYAQQIPARAAKNASMIRTGEAPS